MTDALLDHGHSDAQDTGRPDDSLPDADGLAIGKYARATHHKDGLFSSVYRAEVPAEAPAGSAGSTHVVALKVTFPSAMTPPHDSEREARMLVKLRFSSVIPLIETFSQPGGRLVLVFPFMPCDLATACRRRDFKHEAAKTCLRDLFSAIAYLHSLNVIHRDIKPSNVLLKSPTGPAYLADFGIAWSQDEPPSEPADAKITDVGTTCYRPPELLFGNTRYDHTLDLWAAGCVVAEVTDGSHDTLFDSGELGSELALIHSIFDSLGTPDLQTWPEAALFPDWGKMVFYDYQPKGWSKLLPNTPDTARDLVSQLVRYQSSERLPAEQALQHPYFVES
ncbi:negative regulator of the PHO system [Lineolata rhizophorae]|uniref:cyclin-dependent kinase n=1 Tax=Lineolata rhizophorae TaxID=578093 RepID=A0A6A6NTZ8_9PEZI|nr:negative regulator of the PHO system [Lineolata rhizophorae]